MTRRARLPNESPDWRPLPEVFAMALERYGHHALAQRYFNKALADRKRPIRTKRCKIDISLPGADEEMLDHKHWAEYEWHNAAGLAGGVAARPKPGEDRSTVAVWARAVTGWAYFGWMPDAKKIYQVGVGMAKAKKVEPKKADDIEGKSRTDWDAVRRHIVGRVWINSRYNAP